MWSWSHKIAFLVIGLTSLFLFAPGTALSWDWSVTPGVRAQEKYTNNLLYSRVVEYEEFITSIIPRITVKGITERDRLNMDVNADAQIHARNGRYDTVNIGSSLNYDRYWSERFSTTLNASFKKDETNDTELQEAGYVTLRRTRYRYSGGLSGSYYISERFIMSGGGGYSYTDYPDGPYPNSQSWNIRGGPEYVLDPLNRLGISVDYDETEYDTVNFDKTSLKNMSAYLYWHHQLDETSYLKATAGYRYTWTKYLVHRIVLEQHPYFPWLYRLKDVAEIKSGAADSMIFSVEMDKRWTERFSSNVSIGRTQYNTVDVRSVERNYVKGSLVYRITELIDAKLGFGFDRNKYDAKMGSDSDYYRVTPSISWRIGQNLRLGVGCTYEETDYDRSNDVDRFSGWISLSWSEPRFLSNH